LGEKALDRSEQIKHRHPPTTSAVLTESSRRTGIDICVLFAKAKACVSPLKYRGERRKDQLQAAMRILIVATILFPGHLNNSLERWNEFLLPVFYATVWDFPTAIIKTPIQQPHPP
jgi:hypothetical protein